MADDITEYLTSTVTIAPLSSFDATGAPSYSTQVTVPAKIEARQDWVTSAKTGQEVKSNHVIYVQMQVGIEDRIYLPLDNTSDPTIAKVPIRIDSTNDDTGQPPYWKITL